MLSKGKLIRTGKANLTEGQVSNVSLLITAEMVPAFRFVAYSVFPWLYAADVLADSISVNVESQCLGSVSQFVLVSHALLLLLTTALITSV